MALVITDGGQVRRVVKTYTEEMRDLAASAPTHLDGDVIIASMRPTWELQNQVKALSMLRMLNTPDDAYNLKVARAALRYKRTRRIPSGGKWPS